MPTCICVAGVKFWIPLKWTLLPIGGNDLFGPLTLEVEDLRKDPQVENALLLAEATEQMKGLRPKALCWRHVLLGPWLTSLPWTWPAPNKPDSYARAPARESSGPWGRTEDHFRDKLKANPKSKPRTKFQSKNKIATSYSAPPKQQGQGNKWPSDDKDGSGPSKFPKGHGGPQSPSLGIPSLWWVGEKLAAFHHQWAQHFPNHHGLIRKVSQGLLISFGTKHIHFLVLSCNNKTEPISLAVQKLLKSQATEEVQDTSSPAFYGRLFFVPKPDGSFCPIIDLKVLNQYLEVPSFKMEILFSIAAVLPPREWMIKIDLKDANPHIIVPPNIHKYFRLVVNSVTYHFHLASLQHPRSLQRLWHL